MKVDDRERRQKEADIFCATGDRTTKSNRIYSSMTVSSNGTGTSGKKKNETLYVKNVYLIKMRHRSTDLLLKEERSICLSAIYISITQPIYCLITLPFILIL